MADNPQTQVEKLIKYGNEKFGLNETSIRGILDNASAGGEEPIKHTVQVIDYDGTLLKYAELEEGEIFTLPEPPTRDRLSFTKWCSPVEIVDNAVTVPDRDLTIGALHDTISGLNEFDFVLTKKTGLTVTLNIAGTKDWGDGSSDTATTHTYADYGTYTVTCTEGTMTASSTAGVFGQKSGIPNYYCREIRLKISSNSNKPPSYAFQYCYSLKSVSVGTGASQVLTNSHLFEYCRSLKAIVGYADSVGIGSYGLAECASLEHCVLSYADFNSYSLKNCYSLKTVYISSVYIGSFENCTGLKRARAMYSVRMSYKGCSNLEYISNMEAIQSSQNSSFEGCKKLKKVNLSNKLKELMSDEFDGCTGLVDVYFAGTIEDWCKIKLGYETSNPMYYANNFYLNKEKITEIEIPNTVTAIGGYTFIGFKQIKRFILPETIATIGNRAFGDCTGIEEFEMPDSVTSIGQQAFQNCNELKTIKLSNSLTAIPNNAFSSCYSLEEITIPAGVTSIGTSAFSSCYSLVKYDFSKCTSVPTLAGTNAFSNINQSAKIIVPDALYDEWIVATNWSTYADYIYKASEVV